ncbi:hypothetical protein OS493_029530 [Desmophyllum pertusum]|uniref:Uncharacterized protein n=1 Tax=Desmophyllum pertusum TaxID=174260 RepID=A0A9W9Y8X1_9CNID|nr:hypothetical protein OS493_029530 [Desmophyllum pertusum]
MKRLVTRPLKNGDGQKTDPAKKITEEDHRGRSQKQITEEDCRRRSQKKITEEDHRRRSHDYIVSVVSVSSLEAANVAMKEDESRTGTKINY